MLLRGQRKISERTIYSVIFGHVFSFAKNRQTSHLATSPVSVSLDKKKLLGTQFPKLAWRGSRVGICPSRKASWNVVGHKESKAFTLKRLENKWNSEWYPVNWNNKPSVQVKASRWDIWHQLRLIKANKGCTAAKLTKGLLLHQLPRSTVKARSNGL